jgi:hypothetical protein
MDSELPMANTTWGCAGTATVSGTLEMEIAAGALEELEELDELDELEEDAAPAEPPDATITHAVTSNASAALEVRAVVQAAPLAAGLALMLNMVRPTF